MVRSDIGDALRAAVRTLLDHGCFLPLASPPLELPPGGIAPASPDPLDPLDYTGRTRYLALGDLTTDPIAMVRRAGASDPL